MQLAINTGVSNALPNTDSKAFNSAERKSDEAKETVVQIDCDFYMDTKRFHRNKITTQIDKSMWQWKDYCKMKAKLNSPEM